MKKIFKILFGLLMTITLFLTAAVDVNAEIKLDEEKKEITYIASKEFCEECENYTTSYEIKDNIFEVTFKEPKESEIFSAQVLNNSIIWARNNAFNILMYNPDYNKYDISKDGLALEVTGDENNEIPKLLKINLSYNGRDKEESWNSLKTALVKGIDIGGIGDTPGQDSIIVFNSEFQEINYQGTKLKYEIENGVMTITPKSNKEKLTLYIAENFITHYIMKLELDYDTVDIYNSKINDNGIEAEKLDGETLKSLKLNLTKTGKDEKEALKSIIEAMEYIPEDDPDTSNNDNKNNTKPSGTKVSVKNTAATYSVIAITCGVICVLIGAGLIFVLNSNKKEK